MKIHDLRHTHATIILKQGVNPKIISERLGHTDISLTLRIYSHVLPNMQEEGVKNFGKSTFG
ncbi:tyrosine-type recombinase/integrase [Bacillus thuringiensis serovar fukuokaensis]|nr:tyrosine-type recombinase/integrase [Bacillus sp. RM2(2019)]KXY68495.1 integrase [Bacillus cereus]MRB09538.1 tyrosine-type recombinase/integrase [Bacillus thuringiensis]OTW89603.1 integrase [Bacillus thuringiensis serovar sumiyoshiensis]RFB60558.1 integrase [Bacillus thuringiensis]